MTHPTQQCNKFGWQQNIELVMTMWPGLSRHSPACLHEHCLARVMLGSQSMLDDLHVAEVTGCVHAVDILLLDLPHLDAVV